MKVEMNRLLIVLLEKYIDTSKINYLKRKVCTAEQQPETPHNSLKGKWDNYIHIIDI